MIHAFGPHHPDIDPSAWIHPDATVIGEVRLQRNVSVWPGVVLRGDMGLIEIGADSNVQDGTIAHVTGGISTTVIGERVTVGHRAILHGCTVHSDSLIGMGAILLDNCVIPSGCIVGAGALVTGGKTFPEGHLILGSPAKAVRPLTDKDLAWIAYSWKHYLETSAAYPELG